MSGGIGGEFPRGTQASRQSVAPLQAGSSSAGGSIEVTSQLQSEAAIALEGCSVCGSYGGYSPLSSSEARVHRKNHIDSLYTEPAEERGDFFQTSRTAFEYLSSNDLVN